MAVKFPYKGYWYFTDVNAVVRGKRVIFVALLTMFAEIDMQLISQLGKSSKSMTYVIETLYKHDKYFHNQLNVSKNRRATIAKVTVSILQALKRGINSHDSYLELLD